MQLKRVAIVVCLAVSLFATLACIGADGLSMGTGVSYHGVLWQQPSSFLSFSSGYWAGILVEYAFGLFSARAAATVVDLETLRIENDPQFSLWLLWGQAEY